MVKAFFTVLFFCLFGQVTSGQIEKARDSQFSGIVTEFSDTGKGSLYSLTVISKASSDTLVSLVRAKLVKDFTESLVGKEVTLSYALQADNYLHYVELDSGQGSREESPNSPFRSIVGRLQTCTCGDMDGHMDIELPDGKLMAFKTDHYAPEDVYRGDDIIVHYAVRQEAIIKTLVLQ